MLVTGTQKTCSPSDSDKELPTLSSIPTYPKKVPTRPNTDRLNEMSNQAGVPAIDCVPSLVCAAEILRIEVDGQ